jgi:hypothetical protein
MSGELEASAASTQQQLAAAVASYIGPYNTNGNIYAGTQQYYDVQGGQRQYAPLAITIVSISLFLSTNAQTM